MHGKGRMGPEPWLNEGALANGHPLHSGIGAKPGNGRERFKSGNGKGQLDAMLGDKQSDQEPKLHSATGWGEWEGRVE